MHSLGDVWHLGSEDLESLPGSLLCRIWRIWSLSGATVSLAALFLPIFMLSLGDVWHLGSEDLESLQVLGPCYLSAFLRISLWGPWGSTVSLAARIWGLCSVLGLQVLLCRIWRIWSLWGPVSLAALFLPIFMHSLGDVWHLGSEDLESLQVLGPCYLYAFLR